MSQTSYGLSTFEAKFAGMLAQLTPATIETGISTEASASMPFGSALVYDSVRAAGDQSCLLPSASSGQPFKGFLLHAHNYGRTWTDSTGAVHGELDATGLVPKATLNVLVKGRIVVKCETAAEVGDPVFVRYTTDGGSPAFTQAGAVGNVTGTGRTLDLTKKARFLTKVTAPAQGSYVLAVIEVDMTNG